MQEMRTSDMNTLQKKFNEELKKALQEKLGIKNPNAVPVLAKVVVNSGVKDALKDKKVLEKIAHLMTQITGQKPKVTKAKKSISTFKLREGEEIGLMVTLRGKRMYDFFEKLVTIVMPRLRDFHGVSSKSFDNNGNYTLGFSEYTVFPEIDPGKIEIPAGTGFETTIVTTAKNKEKGMELLKILGMPFTK